MIIITSVCGYDFIHTTTEQVNETLQQLKLNSVNATCFTFKRVLISDFRLPPPLSVHPQKLVNQLHTRDVHVNRT